MSFTKGVEITLDQTRVLRYDVNALCRLEERSGMSLGDILFMNPGMSTLRLILWAGFLHAHPNVTPEEVGEWMQEFINEGGDLDDITPKMQRAMQHAGLVEFEKEDEDEGNEQSEVETETATSASESQ